MRNNGNLKVMLVDDQQLMLDGIKTLLSMDEQIQIVATANSGEEAIELIDQVMPDVILMDIRMPGMGGVEATRRIKESHPKICILILTTFDDDVYIIEALNYGATGYLLKDIDGGKLVESVHEATRGDLLLTGKIARKLASNIITSEHKTKTYESKLKHEYEFSKREMDVIELLVQGYSNIEISKELFLSHGTVKNYISNIYSKLDVTDRTKAVVLLKECKDL